MTTSKNRLRNVIDSGELALGLFAHMPSVSTVDIIAYAGYDIVLLDVEHVPYDLMMMENMVRAAEAADRPTLVRLAGPEPTMIARVLDTGADGVLLPRCSSREEAEQLVRMCRIPPLGDRGACPASRSARYRMSPMDEYVDRANDTVVAVMIETREGLENVEEIVSVPGIDAVVVGPDDLACALGFDHTTVGDPIYSRDGVIADARDRVCKAAKAADVTYMHFAMAPEYIEEWLAREPETRIFFQATDTIHLGRALTALASSSKEAGRKALASA